MIHKTAIVDPNAKISKNVKIGPYTVIGPNVEIGNETEIQSHVNISGNTKIGKKNKIYPFASIGNDPQDLKFKGEKTNLVIGKVLSIDRWVYHSEFSLCQISILFILLLQFFTSIFKRWSTTSISSLG